MADEFRDFFGGERGNLLCRHCRAQVPERRVFDTWKEKKNLSLNDTLDCRHILQLQYFTRIRTDS